MNKKQKIKEDFMKKPDCHASLAMKFGRKARCIAFTMADRRSSRFHILDIQRIAFTMAEILLSLTIIGVVAAITLPTLTGNINERTWNTKKKVLYARMSQAISLMPSLNGYGIGATENETAENAAQAFITDGLAKVLKINNICDYQHLKDCGIPEKFTAMEQTKIETSSISTLYSLNDFFRYTRYITTENTFSFSTKNTMAAAFETQNGESIITHYNYNCGAEYLDAGKTSSGNEIGFPVATMCLNFIYDLNGLKGPNTIGKDMGFITVFNSVDSVIVAPIPSSSTDAGGYKWVDNVNTSAIKICSKIDPDSRIPGIYELSAMFINSKLINLTQVTHYWSGTSVDTTRAWFISTDGGCRLAQDKNSSKLVRCIKR